MTLYVRRFGPHEMRLAEECAYETAGDGTNVTHVVEVFDEELGFDRTEGVEIGPLYVVEDAQLDAFLAEHDGDAEVQETCGFNEGS